MKLETIGIILCVGMLVVCVVACIVQHEERKARRLPPPQPDPRDYSGAFMRDFKRHTR